MRALTLAYSPCPNDTYIFHAITHGLVAGEQYRFNVHLADVDVLNQNAFRSTYDITKLSSFALIHLRDRYTPLTAGGAFGFGCGPVLVAKKKSPDFAVIAVPGEYTTANLLLHLWAPSLKEIRILPFDKIMPAINRGEVDAGVIIHEGRFVYGQYGLECLIDLGAWWETETGLPVPLGCIAARSELSASTGELSKIIRSSLEYARMNPSESRDYIRKHAQELDDSVIDSHISLYVNDFSLDYGDIGGRALDELTRRAKLRGLI